MRNGLPFSIHLSRHHPTWSGKEMPQERTGPRQPPWLWPCYQSSRQAGSTLLHPNSPTPLRGRGVCVCVREKEKNKERAGPKQVKGGGHQAHSWSASTSSSCKFPLGGAGTCSNCKKKKKHENPGLVAPEWRQTIYPLATTQAAHLLLVLLQGFQPWQHIGIMQGALKIPGTWHPPPELLM